MAINSNRKENVKKLTTMLAFIAAFAVSQCFATQVRVERMAGYYSGSGGEFNMAPVIGSGPAPSGYDADVLVNNSQGKLGFETFCVDINLPISVPGTYEIGAREAVPNAVAYLYSEFSKGTLATYDYTPGAARAGDARDLQKAIWYLLGQMPLTELNLNAQAFANMGATAPEADYEVWKLPLSQIAPTGALGRPVQPMLFIDHIPTGPDGGLTVMLLGLALTGLGWFSRRCNA